jgi:hypothetical protein
MLTTYGSGFPDSTLRWDVGGELGDMFLLAASFQAAVPRVHLAPYGALSLDPAALQILATGTIGGPNQVGRVELTLPPAATFFPPLALYSQALVLSAHGGQLTNATTFILQDGVLSQSSPLGSTPPAPRLPVRRPLSFDEFDPEHRLRQLELEDPGIWWDRIRDQQR